MVNEWVIQILPVSLSYFGATVIDSREKKIEKYSRKIQQLSCIRVPNRYQYNPGKGDVVEAIENF
jgi:hypothetical protein